MNKNEIWQLIELELRKAKKKFPKWPIHPAAKAGIVMEESGELMQACLQFKYEKNKKGLTADEHKQRMKEEAVQVAVTAIRFLENLK